jgi:hypothetical protein
MQRIQSVIVAVAVVATIPSLSAQQQIAGLAARKLTVRASAVATIQGNALTSTNGALVNTLVRVRDARLGRIVNQSLTDKLGAYTFKGLDPGNYIVEIVSNNQTALAATNMISANAGETVNAIVKLPFKPSMLATILGQQSSPATAASNTASTASASITELVPQITEQAIPVVVTVGDPVSER